MAEDMNSVNLICRLGRDPELKTLPSGDSIASLWVAVNGRKEDDTSWLGVTAFGKTAEFAGNYLTKGRRIAVKGRLKSRTWETAAGEKRRDVEVIADSLYPLDSKGESAAPADDLAPLKAAFPGAKETKDDSDIPFDMSAV
jgi:single-strand DNA-binding protein